VITKNTKILIVICLLVAVFALPKVAFALTLIPPACTGEARPDQCGLDELFQVFINFANFLLSIIGSVTLLMFVYGGFTWLTSGGSPDKIKRGRDIMVNTVIGIVIVLGAATVIYSVGTALCRGDQSCIRRLNIWSASEEQVAGGVDCRKQENDGKNCGTEKNYVCSYDLRKCVTKCEASADLRERGYSCKSINISPVNEENARAYAETYDCRLQLCPGGWDNLCCPEHTQLTTCCLCEITIPGRATDRYYLAKDSSQCIEACESMADLALSIARDTTTSPSEIFEITPGITPEEAPGCRDALGL